MYKIDPKTETKFILQSHPVIESIDSEPGNPRIAINGKGLQMPKIEDYKIRLLDNTCEIISRENS